MTSPQFATTTARGARVYDIPSPPLPEPLEARSVTTILEQGMNSIGLGIWKTNNAIAYAVEHREELADLDAPTAIERIKRESDSRDAANRGTDIHAIAERIFNGQELNDMEQSLYPAHIDAIRAFVNDFAVEVVATERVVANYTPAYSGSFDLLAVVDGIRTIVDLKTGKLIDKAALQGAAYASAEWVLSADGTEATAMPAVEQVAVLRVTEDGYGFFPSPHPIDSLFDTFCCVAEVAKFESTKGIFPKAPVDPKRRVEYRAEIVDRVRQLIEWGGAADLADGWPESVPTLKQLDTHTTPQLDAIEYLVRRLEPVHRPPDPRADRQRHDDLIGAITFLHDDVIAVVEQYATAAGVPNLRSYQATEPQLEVLERILTIVTHVPEPNDRAARLGRASKGRTTNPAEATDDDVAAFLRTRSTRKQATKQGAAA